MFRVAYVHGPFRPFYGKGMSTLKTVLTIQTHCLLVLSSIIMLRPVFLPINANRFEAKTCVTNPRILRELFMVILPVTNVMLWQNSYTRAIIRCDHCQWCFYIFKRLNRNMTTIGNCALTGIKFASVTLCWWSNMLIPFLKLEICSRKCPW